MTYGTVIVDLERRQVVDLLADRSAASAADWFKGHPEIEIVSRDRAGLYADAARQGAPQARQIAYRFHLLKNFRETIEAQIGCFEAPIRQFPVQAEDDQDTPEQKTIEKVRPVLGRRGARTSGAPRIPWLSRKLTAWRARSGICAKSLIGCRRRASPFAS